MRQYHPTRRRLAHIVTLCFAVGLPSACGRGGTSIPAPPPAPETVAPAPLRFAYAPGASQVVMENRATVRVADSTTTVSDTVITHLYLTVRIGDGMATRPIHGTLDSVTVRTIGGAGRSITPSGPPPIPPPWVNRPAPDSAAGTAGDTTVGHPFDGTVDGGTVRIPIPAPTPADCSSPSPDGAYLASAAELLPSLPAQLTVGASWTASASSTSCRGGVVLTTTADHSYRVEGDSVGAGQVMTRVVRSSRYRIAGSGKQGGVEVTVTGDGSGEGELWVDVPAGRLRSSRGHSTLRLTFTGAGRSQRVEQDAEQRVELTIIPPTP